MVWHALGVFEVDGAAVPALVLDGAAFELSALLGRHRSEALQSVVTHGVLSQLGNWPAIADDLATLAEMAAAEAPESKPMPQGVRPLAPFTPPRIFAAASNYVEHAAEMGTVLAAKAESAPYVFIKASTSVIGPEAPIILPTVARQVDWEIELAAVIGRGGRNIPVEEALAHVAGYAIMNDVSARDLTRRTDFPFKFDWFRGKSFDTFGPFGPWLVPAAVVGDPQKLHLRLDVNGATMQDDETSAMIFTVAEQIAYLSSILTLQPGDTIATGTPDGVGMGRNTFLKDGDVVVASIERIGTLRNPVVAA